MSHYLRDSIRLIKEALSKGVVEGVHEGGVGVVGVEDDDEGDEGVNVRHSNFVHSQRSERRLSDVQVPGLARLSDYNLTANAFSVVSIV